MVSTYTSMQLDQYVYHLAASILACSWISLHQLGTSTQETPCQVTKIATDDRHRAIFWWLASKLLLSLLLATRPPRAAVYLKVLSTPASVMNT